MILFVWNAKMFSMTGQCMPIYSGNIFYSTHVTAPRFIFFGRKIINQTTDNDSSVHCNRPDLFMCYIFFLKIQTL